MRAVNLSPFPFGVVLRDESAKARRHPHTNLH